MQLPLQTPSHHLAKTPLRVHLIRFLILSPMINSSLLIEHSYLDQDIYMKSSLGFAPPSPHLVCKLKKSLYGLWQAPWQWYFKLATTLQDYGFKQSPLDHSLFTYNRGGVFLPFLVYVNDLVLIGNSSSHCKVFKVYLNDHFKLKHLGSLKYFRGIEVAQSPNDQSCVRGNTHYTY